jgi:threonine dehydratase
MSAEIDPNLQPGAYFAPRPELVWPTGASFLNTLRPSDLVAAHTVVGAHVATTPFELSRELSRRFNRSIWLKLENCSPIRSFKARGALACMASIAAERRTRGLVTASTGNHGQGLAFAGQRFGAHVTVVVPYGAEPVKVAAMETLGADIVVAGNNLTEAATRAMELAANGDLTYVEDGEDPGLMAGAATVLWEMLEVEPQLDTVLVPVGGGNLLGGSLLTAAMLRPELVVIGVQSAAAPGAALSWLRGEMATAECRTSAGGLATEHPGALALEIMRALLERMILVAEDDLWRAIASGYRVTGFPIEPAAAAGLAALERFAGDIPGERIGIMITGGRISAADLCRALSEAPG